MYKWISGISRIFFLYTVIFSQDIVLTFGSPVRSMASEDEEDEIFLSPEKQAGDEMIMEWARVGFLCF